MRDKLPYLDRPVSIQSITDFTYIKKEIAKKDVVGTAIAMAAFLKGAGLAQVAKRLLLLGSGFLDHSLGHSVSCTGLHPSKVNQPKKKGTMAITFIVGRQTGEFVFLG